MFNKFFSKLKRKKDSKLIEFNARNMLNDIAFYNSKLVFTLARLSDDDRERIVKTFSEFENQLEKLFSFWSDNDFSVAKMNEAPTIILKSYAENMVILWMLLLYSFRKNQFNNENIEKIIFFIITFKFESYGQHLFTKDSFFTFKSLLENRSNNYSEALQIFFQTKNFDVESSKKLYNTIIENPMNKEIRFDWVEPNKILNVNKFTNIYSNMIVTYSINIDRIWKDE